MKSDHNVLIFLHIFDNKIIFQRKAANIHQHSIVLVKILKDLYFAFVNNSKYSLQWSFAFIVLSLKWEPSFKEL